jgi:hypothetical protein
LSTRKFYNFGNGKRHYTPTPQWLSKIKRISFKDFLSLKELLKNFKGHGISLSDNRAPRTKDFKTDKHLLRPIISKERIMARKEHNYHPQAQTYEPSKISSVYNSSFWQWRRVAEWERYINDPYENININGHIIT